MISDELLAHLRSGGLEALESAIAQSPRGQLLQRCALVHTFDRALFENVLARGIDAEGTVPTFDDLRRWTEIEEVPRRREEYRVRDREQRLLSASERSAVPSPDLVSVSAEVEQYLAANGREHDPERLYHLSVVDPARAEQLFRDAYARADADADLVRCQSILATVRERYSVLPPPFQATIDDYRAYFRARCLWSDDYERTRLYLERHAVTEELARFVESSDARWMMNIAETGGMGKTAALRWLIARHCAPWPRRIPVVRIDFQFFASSAATVSLPELFLEMAAQLDEQLVRAPFGDLRKRLLDELGDGAGAATVRSGAYDAELTNHFASILRESLRGPVLFVFDTIEIPMLNQADLRSILDVMASLHELVPSLRAILSGRYSLASRVTAFAAFEHATRTLTIDPFSHAEARAYLTEKRGIRDDELVAAIIDNAQLTEVTLDDQPPRMLGGWPLMLTLYADLIRTTPGITAAWIRESPHPSVIALIERIIDQIRNPQLHWVVRYGAIPRRLTLDFLREVMKPFLPAPMTGPVKNDDRTRGVAAERQQNVFRHDLLGPGDEPDIDALWRDLQQYAAGNAWVTLDTSRPDTLVFRDDIVTPMRRLLAGLPVFAELHGAAIDFFDRAAAAAGEDAAARTRFLREAIYHRFQLGRSDAESFWRATLQSLLDEGRYNEARQIAAEITGPSYLSAVKPIVRADKSPIIDPALAGEALITESELVLRNARQSGNADDWQRVALTTGRAAALLESAGTVRGHARLAALRATVALHRGDPGTAGEMLAGARPRDACERLIVALAQIELADATDDLDALLALDAIGVARAAGLLLASEPPRLLNDRPEEHAELRIMRASVHALRARGHVAAALQVQREWEAIARMHRSAGTGVRAAIDTAALLLEHGAPAAAQEICRDVLHLTGAREMVRQHVRALLLAAEARRRSFQLLEAMATCDAAAAALRHAEGAEWLTLHALLLETRAKVNADLFEVDAARVDFEQAVEAWRQARDNDRLRSCLEHAAWAELLQFRELDAAQKYVEQMQTLSHGDRAAARLTLIVDFLQMLRGRFAETSSDIVNARERSLALPPHEAILIEGAVMLRTLEGGQHFVQIVEQITPAAARIAALAPLMRLPISFPAAVRDALRRALPPPHATTDLGSDVDAGLQALQLAEILLRCDDRRGAEEAARAAREVLRGSVVARFYAAELRHRVAGARPRSSKDLAAVRLHYAQYPVFVAFLMLDRAERASGDRPAEARKLLRQARELAHGATAYRLLAVRADQLSRHLSDSAPAAKTRDIDEDWAEIELRGGRREADVVVTARGHRRRFARKPPAQELGDDARSDQLISYGFVKRLQANPREAAQALLKYLLEPFLIEQGYVPPEVRLRSEVLAWHAFPWELAVSAAERGAGAGANIRYFYRVREMARGSIHRKIGRVLVIRAGAEMAALESRGESAPPLEILYRDAASVRVVQRLDPTLLAHELRFEPDLIHICASVAESRSAGTLFLQFGHESSKARMTSGVMARVIAASSVTPPVIVLDPPSPPTETEVLRQLLLRNLFAAELFHAARAHSVVAAGLADPGLDGEAHARVIQELRRGVAVESLRTALQLETGPRTPALDMIGRHGVAVFADSPTARVGFHLQ